MGRGPRGGDRRRRSFVLPILLLPRRGHPLGSWLHDESPGRAQRPPDFEATLKFGLALTRLASRDPAVHKLTAEVQNLLKPRSVYRNPELLQKIAEARLKALPFANTCRGCQEHREELEESARPHSRSVFEEEPDPVPRGRPPARA